jgi:hypothetical protein
VNKTFENLESLIRKNTTGELLNVMLAQIVWMKKELQQAALVAEEKNLEIRLTEEMATGKSATQSLTSEG